MIIVKEVSKSYHNGTEDVLVLKNVNLEIPDGKKIAIVGPSGSGKSTLLNIISGIETADSGSVLFDDVNLQQMSEKESTKMRLEKFGFIFQTFNLIKSLTVYDNIILPSVAKNKKYDKEYVNELIDLLKISHRKTFYPQQLSTGEQQRVAIARALVNHPQIIFADEPTGNLDYENSKTVMKILCDCCDRYHSTLLYVTHDHEIAQMADYKLEVDKGKYIWK